MAPFALGYREYQPTNSPASASAAIRAYYFGDQSISPATRDNLTNMFSDRNFFHCTRLASLAVAKHAPVYLYYWTQEGPKSWLDVFKIPKELGI